MGIPAKQALDSYPSRTALRLIALRLLIARGERAVVGRIFLNYRRLDSEAWADRLFERLVKQIPRDNVFMDIDGNIPFGFPWAQWLDQQVAAGPHL
jgi:hypothetical protein